MRLLHTHTCPMLTSHLPLLQLWAADKKAAGWEWGPNLDADTRRHPALLPYATLTAEEQDADRKTVIQTLKMITSCGFELVMAQPGAVAAAAATPADSPGTGTTTPATPKPRRTLGSMFGLRGSSRGSGGGSGGGGAGAGAGVGSSKKGSAFASPAPKAAK